MLGPDLIKITHTDYLQLAVECVSVPNVDETVAAADTCCVIYPDLSSRTIGQMNQHTQIINKAACACCHTLLHNKQNKYGRGEKTKSGFFATTEFLLIS